MNYLKKHLIKRFVLLLLTMAGVPLLGQQAVVSGVASDASGLLIGATVLVANSVRGTTTDIDGSYSLSVDPGSMTIQVSYVGYNTATAGENIQLDFTLVKGTLVDVIVVLGTRSPNRTNTDSSVPIDVINVSKLSLSAPQTSMNQLLHSTTPSFSSNTQSISDGKDHIDPASLRGLGPDQVLVLVNGKRRHTSSLVNVNGTFGRGSVGTDLNAIPAGAIQAKRQKLRMTGFSIVS